MHNLPLSSTLELWEVLTWPSESIWPIPHRCSLLGLFFLLCRYCFEHVRTVWLTVDFSASSVSAVYGKAWSGVSHIYRFPNKKLHGTYSFDGNHHQQSRRQTATYCPREASLNPHSSSRTPHQAESWSGGTVALEERSDGYPRGRPRRH